MRSRRKDRKGFTLIELLATIIILGLLTSLAYVAISSILNRGYESYYSSQEEMLILAGREYYADHRNELPDEIGETSTVTLKVLINEKYIDPIKDRNDNVCNNVKSGVTVQKYSDKDYQYYAFLVCDDDGYETKGDKSKPVIKFSPNEKSSQSSIDVTMTVTDNEKVKSYKYIITKDGEDYKEIDYTAYSSPVKIRFTELGTYEITGYAIDNNGNMADRKSGKYSIYKGIDCAGVDISSNVDDLYSNKNVNLSIKVPKNTYRYEVSDVTDSGVPLSQAFVGSATGKVALEAEGSHQVKVTLYDEYGNTCSVTGDKHIIDRTPPSLSVVLKKKKNASSIGNSTDISGLADYTNDTWYNGYVVTRGSCSDSAGCDVTYKTSGASSGKGSTTANINSEGVTTVTYTATDKAGNFTTATYTVKLDRTAPSLSVLLKKKNGASNVGNSTNISGLANYTNNTWYSGYVVTRGSCNDKVSSCEVTYKNSGASSGSGSTTANINSEGTTTITYRVTDPAGNTASKSYTVKLDRTAPNLSVVLKKKNSSSNIGESTNINNLADYTNNTWYSGYVVARGSCSDNISGCDISYKNSGASSGRGSTTANVNSEGTTTVTYTVKDAAGNTTSRSYTVKLDRTAPSLSVLLKKKTSSSNVGNSTNISGLANYTNNTWYSGYVVTRGNCRDKVSSCNVTYKNSGASSGSGSTTSNINNEGTTTVTYSVSDAAGNSTSKSYTVKLDRTKPRLSVVLKKKNGASNVGSSTDISGLANYTNNTWYSGYVVTRGSCTDSGSGDCDISYKNSGASSGSGSTTSNVNSEGTTTVTYTVEDAAGNTSSGSYTVKLDRTAPSLSVLLKKKNGASNIGNSTNISGLANYTNNTWYSGYVVTRGSCTDSGSGSCDVTYSTSGATSGRGSTTANVNNQGTTTITYRVSDAAGNSKSSSYTVKLDRTAPSLSVLLKKKTSSSNVGNSTNISGLANYTNNTWYSGYVATRGSCSDSISGSCDVTYRASGSSSGSGSTTANVNNEGTTTVTYTVEDAAGNSASRSYTVKLDRTAPSLSAVLKKKNSSSNLSSSSNISSLANYSNNTWYKGYVVTRGSCTDSGSGSCTVSYSLSGASSGSGTTTANVNNEGTTTVRYSVSDAAGNTRSSSYTVKLDRSGPKCVSSGGSSSWSRGPVTIVGTCSDSGSGCTGNASKVFSGDTNTTTASPGIVSDELGNTTTCPANQTVRIDKTAPSCGAITGQSTTWTKNDRTIAVACSDGGSGCTSASFSRTFTTEGATDTISLKDRVGNTRSCKVNKYIDKTPPKFVSTYKCYDESTGKPRQRFGWDVKDDVSGINGSTSVWEYCYTDHRDASCGATCSKGNDYSHKPSDIYGDKYNYYYQSTQYASIGSGETGTAFTGVDASCIDGHSVRTNFKLCDFAGNCAYKENAIFAYSGKGTICNR